MQEPTKAAPDSQVTPAGAFDTTLWTVVLEAGRGDSPTSKAALEKLCHGYWYPLYAYVRRRGYDEHTAQDLTQDFFCFLIEKNKVQAADRRHGRFRSFLLCMLDHFLTDEWRRSQTQKRGGGALHFSLEAQTAEQRYRHEPQDACTPESVYTQRWAQELVDRVIVRLRTEFTEAGQGERFEHLRRFLLDDDGDSQAEIAVQLGMTESAVKSALHRMRQRYSELFREEVANTVANPEDVDAEIRDLIAAL
jgi:RNA polymerase sigma factor (sigma-70 family)